MRGKVPKLVDFFVFFALVCAGIFFTSAYFGYPFSIPFHKAQAAATTWYVNSSAAGGGNGSIASPFNTFSAAYTAASSGDTIDLTGTFDWSNAGETGDTTTGYAGFTLSKSLTISGQGADETFIQANSSLTTSTSERIFTVPAAVNVTIQNVTMRYGHYYNDSVNGSAIDSPSTGNLTILNSRITQNANPARFGGGAIGLGGSGRFIMRNSTVDNNGNMTENTWPGYVAGMWDNSSNTGNEITNCTFFNNGAGYEGAIYATAGGLTITNSTFINNTGSTSGADIYINGATVYLKNNIFGDATAGVNLGYQSGSYVDNGYNIIEAKGATVNFTNGVNGNLVGNQVNLNISHSLADNNSLYGTPTLALSAGSVAINAGNATANNGITIPSEDQRGASRPDAVDMGAFEYGGLIDIVEPTVQSNNIVFSTTDYNKTTLNWTAGNGSRRAVFAKANAEDAALPTDTTTYVANSVFGSGSQIGSTGWFCVYNGTANTVDVTGLTSSTAYTFQVFEFNGSLVGTQNYFSETAINNPKAVTTSAVTTPTTQASNISFSSIGGASATISWNEGSGNKRAVFVKAASSGVTTPVASHTYTANTVFSSGEQIATGWYCVYNGNGSSVTVSGLSAATDYRVQIFEYNGDPGAEHYNASHGSINPRSFTALAAAESEGFESGGLSAMSWVSGGTATNKNWTVTSAEKNSGTYSVKAGAFNETSKTSSLSVTVNVLANGNISFYKKVSSETSCDYLKFYIDGVVQLGAGWAGNVAWSQNTYAVTAGSRTFKWEYSKDGSIDSGSDTAWIDDIVFPQINPVSYKLEYFANDGGSITGSNYQKLLANTSGTEVLAVAETGYRFVGWSDDSVSNPRTDANLTRDVFVTANFERASYSLIYLPNAPGSSVNGSISGSTNQSVDHGSDGTTITAVPNTGYHFLKWSDDSTQNPRRDTNLTRNINVYAVFAIDTHTLSYLAGTGGAITGIASQTINYGLDGQVVTAVPAIGYRFVKWSDNTTTNPRTDRSIVSDFSVSAIFELIPVQSQSNTTASTSDVRSYVPLTQASTSKGLTALTSPSVEPPTNNTENTAEPSQTEEKSFTTRTYEQGGRIYLSEVRFRILDQNGKPISGLLITLHSDPKQATTDENGIVIFKDVESGNHQITLEHEGVKVAKKVFIDEPKVKDEQVQLEVIDIRVSDNNFPWFILMAGILAVGIFAIYSIRSYSKKQIHK